MLRRNMLQHLVPASRAPLDLSRPIEVVGHFQSATGIGESARLCAAQLADHGFEVSKYDLDVPAGERGLIGAPGARILHLNPPMMPRAILSLGRANYAKTYNIGYWAWELEKLPPEWLRALRYVNAVFAPSDFTRAAIQNAAAFPVVTIPHPVILQKAEQGVRRRLGIPEDAFLVATIFNLGSSLGRKNPMAMLRAFQKFVSAEPRAMFVIKTDNPDPRRLDASASEIAAFRDGVSQTPNVVLISERWPAERISGLIAESNAYLSLHRSEGFGLSIAEAILRRVPAVATAWSGNLDFCCPHATWLVTAKQIPVSDAHPEFIGLTHATWADPDADEAARHLTAIAADPEAARAKAERAERYCREALSRRTYRDALLELNGAQPWSRSA